MVKKKSNRLLSTSPGEAGSIPRNSKMLPRVAEPFWRVSNLSALMYQSLEKTMTKKKEKARRQRMKRTTMLMKSIIILEVVMTMGPKLAFS